MKSVAKKRRADHGAAWSDESEASVLFFKQGEANAAAEREAYARELGEGARRQGGRRWLLFLVVAALMAVGAGAVAAHYLASS